MTALYLYYFPSVLGKGTGPSKDSPFFETVASNHWDRDVATYTKEDLLLDQVHISEDGNGKAVCG